MSICRLEFTALGWPLSPSLHGTLYSHWGWLTLSVSMSSSSEHLNGPPHSLQVLLRIYSITRRPGQSLLLLSIFEWASPEAASNLSAAMHICICRVSLFTTRFTFSLISSSFSVWVCVCVLHSLLWTAANKSRWMFLLLTFRTLAAHPCTFPGSLPLLLAECPPSEHQSICMLTADAHALPSQWMLNVRTGKWLT